MTKMLRQPTRRENALQDAEVIRLVFILPRALYTLTEPPRVSAKSESSIMFSKNHKKSFNDLEALKGALDL